MSARAYNEACDLLDELHMLIHSHRDGDHPIHFASAESYAYVAITRTPVDLPTIVRSLSSRPRMRGGIVTGDAAPPARGVTVGK